MQLRVKVRHILIIFILLLTSCYEEQEILNQPLEEAITSISESELPSDETSSIFPETTQTSSNYSEVSTEKEVDLSLIFGDYKGSAIFLDSLGNYTVYNKQASEMRVSPRSTFKIISTLAALEYGIVTPEQSVIEWDGTIWMFDSWNKNLTIQEAFQTSCVWYYRKLIDRIGEDKMLSFLEKLKYGNCDITQWEGSGLKAPEIDGFWLESSLLISPREQVDILYQIFEGETNISQTNIDSLLQMMFKDNENNGIKIYGKTGTGYGGCYVGFFEANHNTTYFAVYLDDQEGASGLIAEEITNSIVNEYLLKTVE